jgi:hypothetical protein
MIGHNHPPLARRHIFSFIPIGLAFAAAGCAPTPTPSTTTGGTPVPVPVNTTTLPQWIQGIEAIGQQITGAIPALLTAGLPTSVLPTVTTVIGAIQNAAGAISSASTATAGQSVLLKIEGFFNQLTPIITPFVAMIPGYGGIIALALQAIPALEGALNIGVSLLTPATVALTVPPASAGPQAMSSGQALNALIAGASFR